MAKFYFHLRDSVDELLDPEGTECRCRDLDEVKRKALCTARDLIAGDAHVGVIDLRYRIDVEDSSSEIAHTLPFDRAVMVRRAA